MIGYYFIQNKYRFVDNKEKEMTVQTVQTVQPVQPVQTVQSVQPVQTVQTVQPVSNIRIKESFDTEEDENENLIHNNKNKGTNISTTYKKLFNYIF